MDVTRDVGDVKHRKRGLRFEKSQLVEFWRPGRTVGFRSAPGPYGGCARDGGRGGGK